jgi:hypothetical protein
MFVNKNASVLVMSALFILAQLARGSQADDVTITIDGQTAGATPFITQLTLTASDTTAIKQMQFTITPKTGSVTRALSGTYSQQYMIDHGYLVPPSMQIFLPVYGLYADYTNTVTLTYYFNDGSSKQDSTTVTTTAFDDQGCGYNTPTVLLPRTDDTSLSYDYIFIRSGCGTFSPVIIDSDSNLRWVSPLSVPNALTGASTFYQNAIYAGINSTLYRIDLDGTITTLHDYSSTDNVVSFHHNIDPGKAGMLIEVDTTTQYEATILDVDLSGNVAKTFNLADIISAAMIAGGDDPSQFVYPSPTDWFHSNAATYNRADDSVIVSSRENFVICIDYATSTIKWILGDQTKKWFTFPSLAAFALDMTPGSLPPIGQHATSLTYDNKLLLFDDGFASAFQQPPGVQRSYSSPRKYQLNLASATPGNPGTATVVYNYEQNQSVYSAICSSVYEDAPNNYLIDYAAIGFPGTLNDLAQLVGLNSAGEQVFYYQYNTFTCNTAYNSLPIHLENTAFPVVGPQALNVSTRGQVSNDDDTLIGGFIVTGTSDKKVALRLLGPSLSDHGVSGAVANPALTLFDSAGAVVATNDDWQTDAGAAELTANGLAPSDMNEAATVQTLAPGAYTVVASSMDGTPGLGLVEVYDLVPAVGSQLGNLSTRGFTGLGDQALISGFIAGAQGNSTIIVRALGPSLSSAGITDALPNPYLTVYDGNGAAIAANDDWASGTNTTEITENGLAPTQDFESALVLHPPAGSYTAIVTGAGGGTGSVLVEVYDLDEPISSD